MLRHASAHAQRQFVGLLGEAEFTTAKARLLGTGAQ